MLPRLTHLHFNNDWEDKEFGAACGFAGMLPQGVFPALESVDFSGMCMADAELETALNGLAATRLQVLVFASMTLGFMKDTPWSKKVQIALSKLEHLREVGQTRRARRRYPKGPVLRPADQKAVSRVGRTSPHGRLYC